MDMSDTQGHAVSGADEIVNRIYPKQIEGSAIDWRLKDLHVHAKFLESEVSRLRDELGESIPLRPGQIIQDGDEAFVDGVGPWEKVSRARIGEVYTPWNGLTGVHVAMRRPASPAERANDTPTPEGG